MLSDDVKLTLVQAALADGQTDPDSTALDMAGFDGVMFVGFVGTVTATGTLTLAAYDSDNNSDFSALTGASAAASDADSDKLLVVDVVNPRGRYVRTKLTRGTANSVYGGTLAIQYKAHAKPAVTAAAQLAADIAQVVRPART